MQHRKLDRLMTPVERIARVAAAGLTSATSSTTKPSGAKSYDNADGTRTIIGNVANGGSNPSYTMATHVGDVTAPGTPTGVTASSKSGVVVVEWDGTLTGGIPDDFFAVRVYLDGSELGILTGAGSVSSASLEGGTTHSVTATAEDDACLPDGTPAHNVSASTTAISVTVSEGVEDVAAEVEQVRQDVADFRDDVATTYATKVEREDGDDAVKTWVTTNYTNSNDLATTYATKTLVSQTKDAIELAASQTYETQSDAAATYATKAALTVGLDGIRSEVAEDYQPKGDYATTASMNSAIQQSASSIESSVAATYLKQSDAATTYATKTEVQQTASGLDTRITTAQSTADGAYLERTATGTTIDTTGAATIRSLVVEGKSVQDGTPSPSAPVPIVSVESRNLLDANYFTSTEGGQTYYSVSGDVLTVMGSDGRGWATIPTFVLPAGTYALSRSNGSGATYVKKIVDGQPTAGYALTLPDGTLDGTFTLSETTTVSIRLGYNATSYPFDVRIQLERGTTANPYQPHGCVTLVAGSTRTDIDLQGHAPRSLPDGTHDEMAVDSLGRVTMTQRVAHVEVNDQSAGITANAITVRGTPMTLFRISLNANSFPAFYYTAASDEYNVLSNQYYSNGSLTRFDGWIGMNHAINTQLTIPGAIDVVTTLWSTAADFKAALATNPLYVDYRLATPQTIDLGTIDLPTPADTLWLDAALVPTIEATWWMVDGIAGQQALDAEVTERQTLIRQFSGGVLAGYVGNAIAALVNAAGSFDVVRAAWSGGVPSILGTLARYAASGISLFDAAGNTLAEFASDHVRIGGDVPIGDATTGGEASVQFFDQTSTHSSSMDASTYIDEQAAGGGYGAYYDMRNEVGITTSLDDDGRVVDTNSSGTASMQLTQEMSYGITATDEQHNEVIAALVADASYSNGTAASHAAIRATASTTGSNDLSHAELIGDSIGFGTDEGSITYFSIGSVISAVRKANSLTPNPFALWAGSKIVNVGTSAVSTFTLFTKAELQAIVGTSWTPTGNNCAVFVMNGDYGVTDAMMSASINSSSVVRVHMNKTRTGNLRVNYLIIRFAA